MVVDSSYFAQTSIDITRLNRYILNYDMNNEDKHSDLFNIYVLDAICDNDNFKLADQITYHNSDYTKLTIENKQIFNSIIYDIDISRLLSDTTKANLYYLDFIIDFYKSIGKYIDKYNILDDNIYLKEGETTNEHIFEFNSKYYTSIESPTIPSDPSDPQDADTFTGSGPDLQVVQSSTTFNLELKNSEKSVMIKYKIKKKEDSYEIVIINNNEDENFVRHLDTLFIFNDGDNELFTQNSNFQKLFNIHKNIMCNTDSCIFSINTINKFTYLYFVIAKLTLLSIIIHQLKFYKNENNNLPQDEVEELLMNFDRLLENNKKNINQHINNLNRILENKNNETYDSDLYNNAVERMNKLNDINLNLNKKREGIEHINNSIKHEKYIFTVVYIILIITIILFIIAMISLFLLKSLSVKYIIILITFIVIYTFLSIYILHKTVSTTKAIEHFTIDDKMTDIITKIAILKDYQNTIKDVDKELTMSLGELVTPLLKKEVKKFEDYNDKTNIYNRIQQFKINIEHYDVKYNIITIKYVLSIVVLLGLMIVSGYYLYDFIKTIIIISIVIFVLLSCIYIIQILKIIRTKSKNTYYTNSRKIG